MTPQEITQYQIHTHRYRIPNFTVLQEPFNHPCAYALTNDRCNNKTHFKTYEMTPHIYMMSLYILFNITTYLEENKMTNTQFYQKNTKKSITKANDGLRALRSSNSMEHG